MRPRLFSDTATGSSAASGQPRASSSQARSKAVYDLAYLVSEQNALCSSPWVQTPHDIKGFYRAVKAKGLLHELSPDELSSLIQLFGSLSILPESPNQSVTSESARVGSSTIHPLTPILHQRQTSGRRTHWAFVLSVANDKLARGLSLGEADNYWLMRAVLEDAKQISSEDSNVADVRTCLDRARKYYTSINPTRDEWPIDQLYLTAILDHGGREYCDEVIVRLAKIISRRGGLSSSLCSVVWRVLAFPGAVISPSTKSHFLRVLRTKLAKVQDVLPRPLHLSSEVQPEGPDNVHLPKLYDALAIRDYLVDIIFSFKHETHQALRYLQEVYPWALFECRAALCAFNDGTFPTSEDKDRAAWSNLVLLALSFAPARKTSGSGAVAAVAPEQGLDGGLHSQSQVLGWTVVCALAALSSELQVRSHVRKHVEPSSVPGIQEITRMLWFLWRKEEAWRAGAVTRATPLICCTTTSFMALASISGDSRLAVSLVQHIWDAIIYPAQLGAECLDRSMLQECAVHFAILVATWGVGSPPQRSWDGILGALRYAQLIAEDESPDETGRTNSIVNSTLMHFTRIDPILSHRLFQSAPEHGLSMKDDVVLAVGKALAVKGHCYLALMYLKDGRISTHNATHLLDILLIYTLHYHRDSLHRDLVSSLTNIFTDTSIRPTNNYALESFIHTCARAGYLEESVKIVQSVCKSSSTLLRPQFLAQLVTALVSHRRYKLSGKVLKGAWHKAPARRSSFFRASHLQYIGQSLRKFRKPASRKIARSLPFSVYVWPILRHHIPFHPRLAWFNKKIISLKLSSLLKKAERLDENTLDQAVHLLVRTGRITAALKLLAKHATTVPTKSGNIILSASLRPGSRKQRRQLRHAAARLAKLVQERGFVPDRVTLNLLMKSVLRWESIMPKEKLRALFDRLTMSGYPLPDHGLHTLPKPDLAPLAGRLGSSRTPMTRTVFGTGISPSSKDGLPVNLRAFPKHISFTRHTRPLYRMFIKALKARGDREGARQVAKVLQEVKESAMRERAFRYKARRLGRRRARQKLQRAKS